MAKKGGLLTLITGLALGAAALFLSKEENREKTKKVAKVAVAKAQKLKTEYQKNPKKVKQEIKKQGKKIATKVVAVAKKKVRKLAK
jgi:DUF438 domain-containing protein